MVANRPNSFVVIDGSTTYNIPFIPTKEGRSVKWESQPWQMGDIPAPHLKDFAFRISLFPLDHGLSSDRLYPNPRTYAKSNGDASYRNLFVPPPAHTTITLTNGSTPDKIVQFDNLLFFIGGRYVYYVNPATHTAVEDKDLGASKAAVDIAVFNNELIVFMGESEKVWKRSIGVNTSGTANVAVTSTDTTLADTRLTLTVNAYIGATVTCNGKTMVVTSNTATEFTGDSWSGGTNPGNGNAWSVAGTWTQATDATYGIAGGLVDSKLWRAETTNQMSNCLTTPLTLTSWSPTSGNKYTVGDTTWAVNTIVDYQGGVWVGKGDGMYAADPTGIFHNQTPQLKAWPHTDNCKGSFVAHGSLWVPSAAGLIRITLGSSTMQGPEIVNRPDYRFWIRGGVEWGGDIYLLATDQASASAENTCIIKMVRDPNNKNHYFYHEWCRFGATTKGYCMTVTTISTVPEIYAGFGNDAKYVSLALGGGRDIDDALHVYGTASVLETGKISPSNGDLSMVAYVQGVETVCKLRTNSTLAVAFRIDGQSYADLLTTQEGSGTVNITATTNYESIIRYAPATASGQFVEIKWTGTHAAGNGTTRDEIIDGYVFGYLRPKMTDRLTVTLIADGASWNGNGASAGVSLMDLHRIFSGWNDGATLLEVQLQDYQDNKSTRFLVTHVERTNIESTGRDNYDALQVTLTRVPIGPDYGVA